MGWLRCPDCGHGYDELASWSVCPHGPVHADGEWCRYHDATPCAEPPEAHPCRCESDDDATCPRHGMRGRPRIAPSPASPAA